MKYDAGELRKRKSSNRGSSIGARYLKTTKPKVMSHHDLLNKYFRREPVILFNLDPFRYDFLIESQPSLAYLDHTEHRISPLS
jgi:hypothetical protein